MSRNKRTPRQRDEAQSVSLLPAAKRQKTTTPAQSGLDFLVDDKARAGKKLDAKLTNGVPGTKETKVDESHAVVAPGQDDEDSDEHEVVDISSGEEDDAAALTNGHAEDDDVEGGAEDEEMEDAAEPSLGDMLLARHPEPIDVNASFADPMAERAAMVQSAGTRVLAPPTTTSLGTVLTQALKTNDRDLLESCFQVTDLPSIRSTIQRLQSQHVGTLLQRLAERIHKRPGRTGNLMVWVQWSLVAHGGYLASQPELMKKLKSLSQVVRERASGLQPMLHLKGKLDLLSAQLDLRRSIQAASRAANADDEDDEDAVLFIEGQDDDSENDEVTDSKLLEGLASNSKAAGSDISDSGEDDSDDDVPNGIALEDDDDEDESDDGEGMLDIEAEDDEDDDDEAEEDSEADSAAEDEDDSEGSEGDESDTAVRQPQPKNLNRKR